MSDKGISRDSKVASSLMTDDVKTLELRGRRKFQWQCSSDRKESLSDPRWKKRKPATRKPKSATTSPPTAVKDARELLLAQPKKQSNFPKVVFGDNTPVTDTQSPSTQKKKATHAEQAQEIVMTAATQTELSIEVHETTNTV